MTTYRSVCEFEGRFSSAPLGQDSEGETRTAARPLARGHRAAQRFPVENYSDARFARDFDPEHLSPFGVKIDLRTRLESLPGLDAPRLEALGQFRVSNP